jgi:hypothetical protein
MYVVKYKRRNGGLTREWSRRAAWTDVGVGLTSRTGSIEQEEEKRPTAGESLLGWSGGIDFQHKLV